MYGILDIEGIQTSKGHICIRKMYILASNGITDHLQEFVACFPFRQIEKKYQNAFNFCRKRIHKLNYYTKGLSMPCSLAAVRLKTFVEKNDINIVLFKGGIIEQR